MARCNIHYTINTGLIIAAGFCDFTAGAGEGIITVGNVDSIPDNFKRDYRVHSAKLMHATEQEKAEYDTILESKKKDVLQIDKILLAAFLVLAERSGLTKQQFKDLVTARYGTLLIRDK